MIDPNSVHLKMQRFLLLKAHKAIDARYCAAVRVKIVTINNLKNRYGNL